MLMLGIVVKDQSFNVLIFFFFGIVYPEIHERSIKLIEKRICMHT